MATRDSGGVAARFEQVMSPAILDVLRSVFRRMNRGMVLLWRLGLGRLAGVWPRGFGRLLVIEHIGRRTGVRYLTPVNYTMVDDSLFCVAAFGEKSDWYRNIMAKPQVAVWLPGGRWLATVEDASDHARRLDVMRQLLLDSGFAAPLFGLHPHKITDNELEHATSSYQLVRIETIRPEKARPGPGDRGWVGAIAVALVVVISLRSRHRRRERPTTPPADRALDGRGRSRGGGAVEDPGSGCSDCVTLRASPTEMPDTPMVADES